VTPFTIEKKQGRSRKRNAIPWREEMQFVGERGDAIRWRGRRYIFGDLMSKTKLVKEKAFDE
jgi:hypothetical protein